MKTPRLYREQRESSHLNQTKQQEKDSNFISFLCASLCCEMFVFIRDVFSNNNNIQKKLLTKNNSIIHHHQQQQNFKIFFCGDVIIIIINPVHPSISMMEI